MKKTVTRMLGASLVMFVLATSTQFAQAATNISVWWPVNNVTIGAVQPFKALIDNMPLSNYQMYWQVDSGQLNAMPDNYTDAPHKEASVDLSGWHWSTTGAYKINFVAKSSTGTILAQKMITIYANVPPAQSTPVTSPTSVATPVSSPVATPVPTPIPSPILTKASLSPSPSPSPIVTSTPVPTPVQVSYSPFQGLQLYVDPNSKAINQASEWSTARKADSLEMLKIAIEPQAKWFGDWNKNIYSDVKAYVDNAQKANSVPVLVAYNIPQRDCGSYSQGGSATITAYKQWIRSFANGIGLRRAVVILEPDALAQMDCLSQTDQNTRMALISDAIGVLKAIRSTYVYVDAGNSSWIPVDQMAKRLATAGIANAQGFSLNVSNFRTTSESMAYGQQLSALIGNKHFIVDTSRNGLGSDGGNWCNPSGRALGNQPTADTGNHLADAFLWIKSPGESDGNCNGGPAAGVWWPDYALGLAQRASY